MTDSDPQQAIVIVAGEASGDILGASLIRALKASAPDLEIYGVGGALMREAGQKQWSDYQPLAVMGLLEVIKHLPSLLKFRKWLLAKTLESKAGLYVGIDAPDFNTGMEKRLKAKGLKTVHYVSPSVWAWREGRAKKFKNLVDTVVCLFPMEPPIYDKYQVPNVYVGHPLADEFDLVPDQAKAKAELNLPADQSYVGLLPGSRLGEIYRLAPVFLNAAVRIRRQHPGQQFLAPMANAACREAFEKLLAGSPMALEGDDTQATAEQWSSLKDAIRLIDGQSRTIMQAADSLILASGTAALEALLAKRPMVVAYKVSAPTYFIAKQLGLIKVDRYSLPNILAGQAIVPELIQADCQPSRIADTWQQISSTGNERLVEQFTQIHRSLQQGGASKAAQAILALMGR